jgi:valyl-tRNA synthetase
MGHALNNTLQDILCRFERMRGRDVLWQPGPTMPASPRRWLSSARWRSAGAGPARHRPRSVHREGLGWKESRRHHCQPAANGWVHRATGRASASPWMRAVGSGAQGVRPALPRRPDLQGQAAGQLGPEVRNRDFRPRGGEHEVDGHMWHFKYPLAGGETYEYVEKDEDGNVTCARRATTSPSPRPGPKPCWATARWPCTRPTSAMRRSSASCAKSRSARRSIAA